MRCRSVLTRLDALRTGELEPEENVHLREHLKSCRSCDESQADLVTLLDSVRALRPQPVRSCRTSVCESVADSFDEIRDDGGSVLVAFTDRGLRMISRGSEADLRAAYKARYCRGLERKALPEKLRGEIEAALRGEGVNRPHVDWSDEASELELEVLQLLTTIPRGEVRTYEWLARQVGRPRAVRAVGNILANNAVPFVVPCHRVIPSAGGVGNYMFGSAAKRELLRREGVDVDALEDLARRNVRFIGSKTTKIVCFPTCKDARRIREENRVPFHGASEATQKGFRPCQRCRPFAAA